jgi:hypothetical protein
VENIELPFGEGAPGGNEVDIFEYTVFASELHIRKKAAYRSQLFEKCAVGKITAYFPIDAEGVELSEEFAEVAGDPAVTET